MKQSDVAQSDRSLRVLLLEDSALDVELVTEALAATGLAVTVHNVVDRADFSNAVRETSWDLILADYVLPAFDGLSALSLARELCPDTPFIFVSGTLGEEVAVEALKRGATDYVLKQRLERLPTTVLRALSEARARAEQQRTQEALHRLLEERTALLHELDHRVKNNLQLLLSLLGIDIRQTRNREVREALGYMKQRLQALAAAHRDLYDGRGAARFDATTFARSLCEELTTQIDRVRITPEFQLEAVEVEAAKAAPIALLFNEIVVNALTHAYEHRHGKLKLMMGNRDGRLLFQLSDDAFSPEEKNAARKGSTGTILRALARQLNADVEWPDDDPATLVRVTMPMQGGGQHP
ncbi:sensor histidine kinase [Microvirga lenta]|uniref:sensor histidine kinase n=1 Tax=Microvirga lenta TaxID=2881337 RepID=UPI001CFD1ADF|nr:histidine kinase dimerization/phosphoacceptor domain -containing protein [Microvirga lenta]MCB5174529.1 response regulator [Microvirga lenta]